jgi:signal transduction histidine kinase
MPRPSWLRPARLSGLAPKYALWITALVAALLVLSGALNLQFAWRENLAHIDALQAEKARGAATRIELFIIDIERQIGWTLLPAASATRSDAVPAGVPSAAALRRIELLKLLRQAPAITDVAWIDADGLEQARVSRLALNQLGHGLPRHDDPAFTGTAQGRTWRSSITFRQDSEPYLRVARRASAGGGVTVADINLKFVWDVVASPVLGAGSVAYVVTDDGTLVAHPDISLVLKKTDMRALPQVQAALAKLPGGAGRHTADAVDTAGRPVLAAAARIDTLGWTVLVESPRSQALAPVLQSAWRLVAVVAAGLLLSVLASVLLARSLTRPIQVLQMGADRIGAGDLEHRIAVTTHDEVQALAERFNQMAGNLQASVSQLEQRVAERTRELAAANEAKSHFIAAASHDLRQPVHALGLFVGQLRGETEPASQRELLQHIEHSVAAFEALLEALLDISRLDAGTVAVRRQPQALAPLLHRLVRGQAGLARRKGLRLAVRVVPEDLAMDSDPVLLERILGNLLGNALRYTARGGVLIAARRRHAGSGPDGGPVQVELRVIDSGQGISAQDLPLVFQEFHRGQAQAGSNDPGLGLGLAIVRRLTDLLQHPLGLRSVPGRGTCFTLWLPEAEVAHAAKALVATSAAASPPVPSGAPDPLLGRRVLVIDDDAAVREAMRGQLQQWGLHVVQAADEAAAWAAFADPAALPDVVLADLRLSSGVSGLQLAQRLRALHAIPLAIISGETDAQQVQSVRDAGLPLLSKPLRPARLRAQLEAMLALPAV